MQLLTFEHISEVCRAQVSGADMAVIGRHQDTRMNEFAISAHVELIGDIQSANTLMLHRQRYYLAGAYDNERHELLLQFHDSLQSERTVHAQVAHSESQYTKLGVATAQIGSLLVGGKIFTAEPDNIDQTQLDVYEGIAKEAQGNNRNPHDYLSAPRKVGALKKLNWIFHTLLNS